MEVALRQRLAGVAAITISEGAQTTEVIFAPGDHPFSVEAFKAALKQADVEVVTMEVDACGTIEQHDGRRLLQAGATTFVVAPGAGPSIGPVCVAGRLSEDPGQLTLSISRVD